MYPNSNTVPEIMPEMKQSTMPIPARSNRQQRLEKGIKFFASKMFKIQLILTLVFSITEISFGGTYIGQCPVQREIPIFLLVHGSTKIVWVGCGIIAFIEAKYFSNSPHIAILMLINLIIQVVFMLFFLAWFIAGNVWVWSVKGSVQTTDSTVSSTYCQSTLYGAAQGLIISTYIVFGIITLLTVKRVICKNLVREHGRV
jgi:hypothetical protein